jgi:hypothetical protein
MIRKSVCAWLRAWPLSLLLLRRLDERDPAPAQHGTAQSVRHAAVLRLRL